MIINAKLVCREKDQRTARCHTHTHTNARPHTHLAPPDPHIHNYNLTRLVQQMHCLVYVCATAQLARNMHQTDVRQVIESWSSVKGFPLLGSLVFNACFDAECRRRQYSCVVSNCVKMKKLVSFAFVCVRRPTSFSISCVCRRHISAASVHLLSL